MSTNTTEKYRPIIGLEIHVEYNTQSKMFCGCSAEYFGKDPNTHTCPVCLGLPGALPVPNRDAIERTILLGQALNCEINKHFKFDRKHYFYPDIPKGFQTSQYDEPIAEHGSVTIQTEEGEKTFRITRVHLEEDTGKLTHVGDESHVDLNRSGVPLVEIVTEADFDNGEDVKRFLQELQVIIRHLGIANADMEKGDMRLEPNISVQLVEKWPEFPPYKVEVKNINSFSFAKRAIEFEIDRQTEILETGEIPPQETRGYDSNTGTTVSQRLKEDANDYRYFPEPDIPPFDYTDKQLEEIRSKMPELPGEKVKRYVDDFGLKYDDAFIITRDVDTFKYFESVVKEMGGEDHGLKNAAVEVAKAMVNKKVSVELDPKDFVKELVKSLAPKETDTGLLDEIGEKVLSANTKAVDDFKSGSNPNAIMFLLGQVMHEMKGQADANVVKAWLEERLG